MSRRLAKVNSLLREEIAQILERDIDFPPESLVSVVRVDAAADLRTARVFISVFNGKSKTEAIMDKVRLTQGYIRAQLGKVIRLKYTPELTFIEDTAIRDADRILSLMRQVAEEQRTAPATRGRGTA